MFATEELGRVIQDLLRKDNFVPLEIVIADGRVVRIGNREQAWIEGSLLYVAAMKSSEAPLTEIVALRHVALVRVRDELTPRTIDDCPF
ncbi:MAG TPA: hypothetical protein VIM11_00705 [Tepidisphaeraceae bacterium]|jgi:hypothetical protein